ncbi:MAG: zinc metallopeptidase [Muribaculaceae bacterium]|nr:zinc metallopeptidase [Muribaculaceae bacterium]
MIYLIFFVISLVSWLIQNSLKNKFEKYSRVPIGFSGAQVAQMMLMQNGINDVAVRPTQGELTDFFDPTSRSVNLSEPVYGQNTVAAAAVAAHECGHAVQHRVGYSMLVLRTKLVPAVSFASKWMMWLLLGGILVFEFFPYLLGVGVALFALTTLFSLITLPVEIDASRRAVRWLETAGITQGQTTDYARDALKAAAYTYVVAALGSLATLFYYARVFLRR